MLRLDPRSWPIRWRLTALNVGVLVVTLLAVNGVFLFQLESALLGISVDHLRDQARAVLQPVEGPRGPGGPEQGPRGLGPRDRPGQSPLPSFGLPRVAVMLVRRLSGPDTGALVFDTSGALVAASEVDADVEPWPEPPPEDIRAALGGAERSVVIGQESRRALVLLLPLPSPDGTIVGALALANSLDLVDQLEARLRAALIVGAVLAVLVAGGLSLRASREALRPLDRVVRAARKIGAGQLDERLRLHRPDEIGALAEAFDSMLDRLAAAMAAQRRFVADAAHELRTPLTALGGMVEMLQMGADRGDQATVRRMLDTMDREIGRLGRLVADLLTLSRLDAEQPLALAPVELTSLVTDVANQTRLLASGQEVQLRIEASPIVQADADRLKQVLINLADNALKFTPPDGQIEFRLDAVGGVAEVAVADTGSGIPPEVLPRVTERFERGDPSRARKTGGFGLGLAIARGIVEAHGGTLAIESEVGRGTTVRISLPRIVSRRPAEVREVSAAGVS